LLEHLARHGRIFGSSAATVRRLKDPEAFAALCRDCAVPHPEVSRARPSDTAGWLAKRIGGAGGSHVVAAAARDAANFYYQRRVPGEGVSALFLSDGKRALVLGLVRNGHRRAASALSIWRCNKARASPCEYFRFARRRCAENRARNSAPRIMQCGFSCREG